MSDIGLETPFSIIVDDKSDLNKMVSEVSFPLILRPFYTLGGRAVELYTIKMNLFPKLKMLLI